MVYGFRSVYCYKQHMYEWTVNKITDKNVPMLNESTHNN